MAANSIRYINSAHSSYTLLSLCIDKNIATHYTADKIRHNIMALLMNAFNTERINQYQILQLLDCLNSLAAYTDWHSESQNPFINNLKKQLELYPEAKFSIEEMAQNAFISKYHFIRSFKAEVGLTPHQFQLQNRIRKAQRLMHNAETITEVALTTGFCDQSHFIKQFEKQVGLPPLTYKLSSQTILKDTSMPFGNIEEIKTGEIKLFIIEHYQDVTLDMLASHFAFSPSYLSRLIKRFFGVNYSHLLQSVRLEKAKDLLRNTDMHVTDISANIGYESNSYFISIFKQAFSMTPSQYRNTYQNQDRLL